MRFNTWPVAGQKALYVTHHVLQSRGTIHQRRSRNAHASNQGWQVTLARFTIQFDVRRQPSFQLNKNSDGLGTAGSGGA
jgi:hypothetical protein